MVQINLPIFGMKRRRLNLYVLHHIIPSACLSFLSFLSFLFFSLSNKGEDVSGFSLVVFLFHHIYILFLLCEQTFIHSWTSPKVNYLTVRHYMNLIDRLSYMKLQQLQWSWYHHIGMTYNGEISHRQSSFSPIILFANWRISTSFSPIGESRGEFRQLANTLWRNKKFIGEFQTRDSPNWRISH